MRVTIVPMIIGPYQGVEIFFIPKTPLSRNHDSVLQNAHQNRDFFFTHQFSSLLIHIRIMIALYSYTTKSRFHCILFVTLNITNESWFRCYIWRHPLTKRNHDFIVNSFYFHNRIVISLWLKIYLQWIAILLG